MRSIVAPRSLWPAVRLPGPPRDRRLIAARGRIVLASSVPVLTSPARRGAFCGASRPLADSVRIRGAAIGDSGRGACRPPDSTPVQSGCRTRGFCAALSSRDLQPHGRCYLHLSPMNGQLASQQPLDYHVNLLQLAPQSSLFIALIYCPDRIVWVSIALSGSPLSSLSPLSWQILALSPALHQAGYGLAGVH